MKEIIILFKIIDQLSWTVNKRISNKFVISIHKIKTRIILGIDLSRIPQQNSLLIAVRDSSKREIIFCIFFYFLACNSVSARSAASARFLYSV